MNEKQSRLDTLKKRQEQLRAQIQKLESLEKSRERKRDARVSLGLERVILLARRERVARRLEVLPAREQALRPQDQHHDHDRVDHERPHLWHVIFAGDVADEDVHLTTSTVSPATIDPATLDADAVAARCGRRGHSVSEGEDEEEEGEEE